MISDFVKTRLDQMLAYPENWGGPEAYELQVLLLIEIEMLLAEKVTEADSLRVVLDRYAASLQRDFPTHGAQPLSVATDDMSAISEHLARFRESGDAVRHGTEMAAFESVKPSAPDTLGSDLPVEPAQTTMPRAA